MACVRNILYEWKTEPALEVLERNCTSWWDLGWAAVMQSGGDLACPKVIYGAQGGGKDNTGKTNRCWKYDSDAQCLNYKHIRGVGDAQTLEYIDSGKGILPSIKERVSGYFEGTHKMWLSHNPQQKKELFLSCVIKVPRGRMGSGRFLDGCLGLVQPLSQCLA